jgi:pimeloyl-ACP methyl ester carboxylesterase
MKTVSKTLFLRMSVVILLLAVIGSAYGQPELDCSNAGVYNGAEYCIVVPEAYNDRLVIWAHGFQDAGTGVGIPLDQLCFDGACTHDILTDMGFAFATSSYRTTGLAVVEGVEDILDLVDIFINLYGNPARIYVVGASEGGLITALLTEDYPEVFSGGYALCGPIGDFPYQINYLGDARVTFEYFFPNRIPGYGIFNSNNDVILPDEWDNYFETTIKLLLLSHPNEFRQWAAVARLPKDANDPVNTLLNSSKDVLRYPILNLLDAAGKLGGFPFENRWRWYRGSDNDLRLNWRVKRFKAHPDAVSEMKTNYNTSGHLDRPLITSHTTQDQQVPYAHEFFYFLKTIASGSFLIDHVNIPIVRYGHCQFRIEEALAGFSLMLLYSGDLQMLSGVSAVLQGDQLKAFESIAQQEGITFRMEGERLKAIFK